MLDILICGECGSEVTPEFEMSGINADKDVCTIWCDSCNAPAGGLEGVAYKLGIDRFSDLVDEVEYRMSDR